MKEKKAKSKINSKAIMLDDVLIRTLKDVLKEYKINSYELSEAIKKDKSYISHVTNGDISKLQRSVFNKIIVQLGKLASEGMEKTEAKEVKDKIFYRITQALPGSYMRMIYDEICNDISTQPETFYAKDLIEIIMDGLKEGAECTPSEFIEEIVNQKKVEVINYDGKSTIIFQPAFHKDYIDNLLLDEEDECHQKTTFIEMSAIVYCFFELLQSKAPEIFEEYASIEYFASRIGLEDTNENYLRKITFETLFLFEYPDYPSMLASWQDDGEMRDMAKALELMRPYIEDSPHGAEMIKVGMKMSRIDSYAAEVEKDENFFAVVVKSLEDEGVRLMYNIYGKDYTKIKGDHNRDMFTKEFNALFEKYSNQEESQSAAQGFRASKLSASNNFGTGSWNVKKTDMASEKALPQASSKKA